MCVCVWSLTHLQNENHLNGNERTESDKKNKTSTFLPLSLSLPLSRSIAPLCAHASHSQSKIFPQFSNNRRTTRITEKNMVASAFQKLWFDNVDAVDHFFLISLSYFGLSIWCRWCLMLCATHINERHFAIYSRSPWNRWWIKIGRGSGRGKRERERRNIY